MTGLSVIAAEDNAKTIQRLNRRLTVEVCFIAAFVSLDRRDPAGAVTAMTFATEFGTSPLKGLRSYLSYQVKNLVAGARNQLELLSRQALEVALL